MTISCASLECSNKSSCNRSCLFVWKKSWEIADEFFFLTKWLVSLFCWNGLCVLGEILRSDWHSYSWWWSSLDVRKDTSILSRETKRGKCSRGWNYLVSQFIQFVVRYLPGVSLTALSLALVYPERFDPFLKASFAVKKTHKFVAFLIDWLKISKPEQRSWDGGRQGRGVG